MQEVTKVLKKYGLSDHETKVYIALLRLVEASAYTTAENADLPRTSTYTALETLKNKGLVNSSLRNNVRYYTPENPKILLDVLEEKKKEITEILPDLSNLINTAKVLPTVKLYKGKEGYIRARNEMLENFKKNKIKHILVISSPMDFNLFPKYFPNWIEERKKLGVSAKTFLRYDAKSDTHFQMNELDLRETKFLPANFEFDGTMNIYGNKIALFALKENELNSIIIDSPVLAKMLQQFFNFTWSLVTAKS